MNTVNVNVGPCSVRMSDENIDCNNVDICTLGYGLIDHTRKGAIDIRIDVQSVEIRFSTIDLRDEFDCMAREEETSHHEIIEHGKNGWSINVETIDNDMTRCDDNQISVFGDFQDVDIDFKSKNIIIYYS